MTRVADTIALAEFCGDDPTDARSFLIDANTQEVRYWPGFFGQHQAISPDGTRLVRQEQVAPPVVSADGVVQTVGPLVIRDLTDGDVVVELEGVCTYEFRGSVTPETEAQCEKYPATPFVSLNLHTGWTPDSKHVVMVRPGVTVWDATTGKIVSKMDAETLEDCPPMWLLAPSDGERLLFGCDTANQILELSTRTWEHSLVEAEGWRNGALVGFTPDGDHLVNIRDFQSFGAASLAVARRRDVRDR